jgi:hypothetical protein
MAKREGAEQKTGKEQIRMKGEVTARAQEERREFIIEIYKMRSYE